MAGILEKTVIAIPVWNNAETLRDIAERSLAQGARRVIVVDDGSTDCRVPELLAGLDLTLLSHERNLGKGAALRTALAEAAKDPEILYMISIDADGQHFPEDVPALLPAMEVNDHTLVVGVRKFAENAPLKSIRGRSFANFWMKVETGVSVADCQSGFRAYPVRYIPKIRCCSNRYDWETEILTRAAWAGLDIACAGIRVYYPEPGKRVSHFRPFLDNLRISLIHTRLIGERLIPFPKRKLVRPRAPGYSLRHPKRLLVMLLAENSTPLGLAASAALGTFLGVLPLIGFHIAAIIYFVQRLHLNQVMALAIQNLFMPPLSPLLCIELGYWLRHGEFLTEVSMKTVGAELHCRIWEWFLGSLILAPFWAVVTGLITYAAALMLSNRRKQKPAAGLSSVRGTGPGAAFFRCFMKVFGLRHACNFVWIVAFFYALFDAQARAKIMPYVRHRFPHAGAFARFRHVLAIFAHQGESLLILRAAAEGSPACRLDSGDDSMVEPGKPAVLICSHFGPWQTLIGLAGTSGRTLSVLMQPDSNANVDKLHSAAGAVADGKIHPVSTGSVLGGLMECDAALDRGELVAVMGDRSFETRPVQVDFLGESARFPVAGFYLAARHGCAIHCIFTEPGKHFGEFTTVFRRTFRPVLSGRDRSALAECVKGYVSELEALCMKFPDWCFLFEDVWSGEK